MKNDMWKGLTAQLTLNSELTAPIVRFTAGWAPILGSGAPASILKHRLLATWDSNHKINIRSWWHQSEPAITMRRMEGQMVSDEKVFRRIADVPGLAVLPYGMRIDWQKRPGGDHDKRYTHMEISMVMPLDKLPTVDVAYIGESCDEVLTIPCSGDCHTYVAFYDLLLFHTPAARHFCERCLAKNHHWRSGPILIAPGETEAFLKRYEAESIIRTPVDNFTSSFLDGLSSIDE